LYLTTSKQPAIRLVGLLLVLYLCCTTGIAQTVVLDSITPSTGTQGSAVNLTLTGSGFTATSTITFSNENVVVKSIKVLSSTSIEAAVILSAPAGDYSLSVRGASGSVTFSVLPSPPSLAAELDVSDFAGSAKQDGSNDGPAKDARFYAPFGGWVDSGNLYVADYVNSTIRKISLGYGAVTTLAGQAGAFGAIDGVGDGARFGEPVGIWAHNDSVFVTDAHYDTIRKISISSGTVTTLAGSASETSGSADGTGSLARFRSPAGIWGDGKNLYICDSLNFTIRKLAIATGEVTTLAGAPQSRGQADGNGSAARFYAPTEIWGNGIYLYVADGNAIRRVTIATGDVQTLAGSSDESGYTDGAANGARFSFIGGVWGDGGSLFIADSGNQVIRKMKLNTGYVTTVAGLVATPGAENGRGNMARFEAPAGIAGDGSALYIVDSLNSIIRRAVAPTSTELDGSTLFELSERSGISRVTSGNASSVQVGHGRVHRVTGTGVPSGVSILSLRQNGMLVSEAAFPTSPLSRSGRIPVEISATVNTGVAVANPNNESVVISFYVTDSLGVQLYSGQASIPGNGQLVAFLDQPPFSPPQGSGISLERARTLTFNAAAEIGIAGVRGLTNERGEFLMTALPVSTLNSMNSQPVLLPLYADGGGWKSQVVLVNPTDSPIIGKLEFFSQGSGAVAATPAPVRVGTLFNSNFNYVIPARSSVRFQTSGEGGSTQVGSVRLSPLSGSFSPTAFLVVSFRSQGITVSEAGVPGLSPNSSFRLYVERSGNFDAGATDSIQSAFAISNPAEISKQVAIELTNLDGTPTGLATTITVPGNGQVQMFLNQLPGFANLPNPFKGIFRISGDSISVIGLRARYNGRRDFLLTTTSPVVESASSPDDLIFPLVVNGQGYTTQLVLFGGSAGQSRVTLSVVNQSGQAQGFGFH
jgi:hypothetical protein